MDHSLSESMYILSNKRVSILQSIDQIVLLIDGNTELTLYDNGTKYLILSNGKEILVNRKYVLDVLQQVILAKTRVRNSALALAMQS